MKYKLISTLALAAYIFQQSHHAMAEISNAATLKDESYAFSVKVEPRSQKIWLRSLKANEDIPDTLLLKLQFADRKFTEVQVRLVSAYENKNQLFEGYLGPSATQLVGIELSFKTKYGLLHDLRWRFDRADRLGNK